MISHTVKPSEVISTLGKSLLTGKSHDIRFIRKSDKSERWMNCRINLDKLYEVRRGPQPPGTVSEEVIRDAELRLFEKKRLATVTESTADSEHIRSFRFDSVIQWIVDGDVYQVEGRSPELENPPERVK